MQCAHKGKGCGYVARGPDAKEAGAWCWHHELLAHEPLPDLQAIIGRAKRTKAEGLLGFPGTESAVKWLGAGSVYR